MKIALALLILLQTGAQSVGYVTGVVRGANGMPAAGVRVYAIGVRDDVDLSTAPLEGQAQTDAAGRYRLEVPPGRYYVGSGSVSAPTFFPGARGLADARVVTVATGGIIEAIDFSSFVPPPPSGIQVAMGTAVLSGVIRFPDGAPAAGIAVTAVSQSAASGTSPTLGYVVTTSASAGGTAVFFAGAGPTTVTPSPSTTGAVGTQFVIVSRISFTGTAVTDTTGRYVLSNVAADTFYVAAGFAESPILYPGVTDRAAAKTVTTTAGANLSGLDFTVPRPAPGVSLRGQVRAIGGTSAGGSTVEIRSPSQVSSPYGLPSGHLNSNVAVSPDGKFEFRDVRPGPYVLYASHSAIRSDPKTIVVADQPLVDLDLQIRAAVLSGRIVAEDGSPFPDARAFVDAIVSTTSEPNMIATTFLPIAGDGSFSRILEADTYRFMLRALPEEYFLKSITTGSVDLMREPLKIDGTAPEYVEVRVGKRTPVSSPSGVRVRGRVLDAVSGAPSSAERVSVCCRETGPVQRFSTPIDADGSFEFTGIPSGHYLFSLQVRSGTPNLFPVEGSIELGVSDISAIEVLSTPQFGELAARLFVEGNLPPGTDRDAMAVVFTGSNGKVRVVAGRRESGSYSALLPSGDRYNLAVTNLPEGFFVKDVSGSTEVQTPSFPRTGSPPVPTPIVITVAPK
ncbi:MAG TPA: carboxypeptidase-like regulatory domain-containing protein [Terriglobia bacterium]|nr:carboxypeptidase-like regulatory domain-containing protein [Terriglobia bacterium]